MWKDINVLLVLKPLELMQRDNSLRLMGLIVMPKDVELLPQSQVSMFRVDGILKIKQVLDMLIL
jgi:hypothetical protein